VTVKAANYWAAVLCAALFQLGVACAATATQNETDAGVAPKPVVSVNERPLVVEFVVSDEAQMIDLAGPWEVLYDAQVGTGHKTPDFVLYTVAETTKSVRLTGGMSVTPDYSFDNAPHPDYVVVGKQGSAPSARAKAWLVEQYVAQHTLVSVCTGAFWLGAAGLLDHKSATTHHDAFDAFRKKFPAVNLVQDARYVQSDPHIFTSGGLTSGIDLALHLVELRFGREAAARTAAYMEYKSKDWSPDSGSQ
jgi:transcriptional regulator GlxA family with amidase domain